MPSGVIVNGAPGVTATDLATGPLYVGWGTGVGTSAVTDTTLFNEVAADLVTTSGTRVTGTASRVTTTLPNDTFQLSATLQASQNGTVTNVGVFDNPTIGSGNLFGKCDYIQALFAGDKVTVTFQCPISN